MTQSSLCLRRLRQHLALAERAAKVPKLQTSPLPEFDFVQRCTLAVKRLGPIATYPLGGIKSLQSIGSWSLSPANVAGLAALACPAYCMSLEG